jgi:hypothetical protein
MAVNLENNFPVSLNQQLKLNLSNNLKFVVNNIQVYLCNICSFLAYFPRKKSEVYEITNLSVCLCFPPNNF